MIKRKAIKNPVYLSAAIILVVIALGVFWHFHNKNKDIIPTTNPVTSANKSTSSTGNQQPTPATNPPPSDSAKNPSSQVAANGATLTAPYGTFVSNHRPSLSGANNIPGSELSTCTTTPGATCYIKFTKGDQTRKLPSQNADGSGSTNWHWDVSQAGLSEGTWDITAVATLNGQTKSTNDAFKLEVQQ